MSLWASSCGQQCVHRFCSAHPFPSSTALVEVYPFATCDRDDELALQVLPRRRRAEEVVLDLLNPVLAHRYAVLDQEADVARPKVVDEIIGVLAAV